MAEIPGAKHYVSDFLRHDSPWDILISIVAFGVAILNAYTFYDEQKYGRFWLSVIFAVALMIFAVCKASTSFC
jgi:hypothetical protein